MHSNKRTASCFTLMLSLVAALAAAAVGLVAPPAQAQSGTETYFAYTSARGDVIGEGGSGKIAAPAELWMEGTVGSMHLRVQVSGDDFWDVFLQAPRGGQLGTGVYGNVSRAGFNVDTPGLSVTRRGLTCGTVAGRFTVYALTVDPSGRITTLDADLTQNCEGASAALQATVKYGAPPTTALGLTSSAPTVVAGQSLTLTARGNRSLGAVSFVDGTTILGQATPDSAGLARWTSSSLSGGSHSIGATQGTLTSPRVPVRVASAATSLVFRSPAGDFLGAGATVGLAPQDAVVTVTGDAHAATIYVDTGQPDRDWHLDLWPTPGGRLSAGSWSFIHPYSDRTASQAGFDMWGSGRGCSDVRGSLTIHEFTAAADGAITGLDVSFTQDCLPVTDTPLQGRLRFRAGVPAQPLASSITMSHYPIIGTAPFNLLVTVAGTGATPKGEVAFTEGDKLLGTEVLDSQGGASFPLVLAPGSHTITATYRGNSLYRPSHTSLEIPIGTATAPTETALTASRDTVRSGRTVAFAVMVNSGTSIPTGTVTLFDGSTRIGSATLSNGSARVVWTAKGQGRHTFTANYAGDAAHAASVSSTVNVRVR